MNKVNGVLIFVLGASLGLGCGGNALKSGGSGGSGVGGQGGSSSSGGAFGSGGAGTGGATCAPVACPAIGCLYGDVPNPDPCGCPICASPDAGTIKDAATDACVQPPCASYPVCGVGHEVVMPPCGCPACVPVDAGTDTAKLACVALDECTCGKTSGCASIAEACYCPYPQCGNNGACVCGGGQFIGCAPANLTTCAAAKDRIATLCPQLKGATFDGLCQPSDSACITKCLNDVTSCTDVFCSFCEGCDCASDAFMACRTKCTAALTQ